MNGNPAEYDTPNIRASEAIVTIHSRISIDAPASEVFRTLRNTETWKDWNRFVPKCEITYQPPEEDHATAAEIQEIVRNTTIIGSFYSDLTDGGIGQRKERRPDEQPPPRFRLNSHSSQLSATSHSSQPPRLSHDSNNVGSLDHRHSIASVAVGPENTKSAASKFQEAQESRRASIASGTEPAPPVHRVENSDTHRGSIALPSSPVSPSSSRRKSKQKNTQSVSASSNAAQRSYQALMSMYGEPSVRLQIKTKMTFFCRMKPASPSEFTETKIVVTDIARPDDPITETGTTALTRSTTHNLDGAGLYRIVWAGDTEGASILNVSDIFRGSKLPKYLLQSERVHEITPTGDNTCEYRTWECMKGHAAKTVKKKYGEHLQKMFEVWAQGLKDYCEGLHAPKIAVRDFSTAAESLPVVIHTLV